MKRGQLLIILLAVVAVAAVAVVFTGGDGENGDGGGTDQGPAAPAGAVRIPFAYSPEKEKLLTPLIRRFNEQRDQVGGKPIFVEGEVVSSGEAETNIAAGRPAAGCLVARLVAVGTPAQLRGRSAARARGEPLDRADAAGDRHVGAVRAGARLAEREDRLRADHPPGALEPGLRGVRAPRARPLQAGSHQSRFLHLGPRGGGGRVLRGDRQEGGLDRAGRGGIGGAPDRARHRALDRPLRRHHAVHRRSAAQGGPGLRLGGGHGGGHPARVQQEPRTSAQADRALSPRGHLLLRQPVHRARRLVGERRAASGRRALRRVPGSRDHPRAGRPLRLPPGGPGDRAGGARVEGERRGPGAARAGSRPARAADARPHPARLA